MADPAGPETRDPRRRRLAIGAPVRRRRGAGGRLPRTILLGAVAVILGLAWLARELGLDREALLDYAATSLLLVGALVLLGLAGSVLLWLARRLLNRTRRPPKDGR